MTEDRALLLVLMDGLPYAKVSPGLAPFLASLPAQGPVEPGLGFSINIYAEMFAGRQPDDVGYFNKWRLKKPEEIVPPNWLSGALATLADVSRVSQLASRGLHKIWERLTGRGNLANIPFRLLPFFAPNPSDEVFETADYPTAFRDWSMHILRSPDFPGSLGIKDERTVEAALEAAASRRSVFVLLGDLDGIAHAHGMSDDFDNHIRRMDKWCRQLSDAFGALHGERAHVVFVSDHGMAPTDAREAVSVDLEKVFGPVSYEKYVPFVDALMLRVWVQDPALLPDIEGYLGGLSPGRVLSGEERRHYGVMNRAFGDVILLLDEGSAFFPSFFGARFPLALRGYDPRLDSQQAFFGYAGTEAVSPPSRAVQVYEVLKALRLE
jgi:hypothetical protein